MHTGAQRQFGSNRRQRAVVRNRRSMHAFFKRVPNASSRHTAVALLRCDANRMKRIEFTIIDVGGESLHEPGFVETCSELPLATMLAVEDFLEAHDGELHLPITIHVRPSSATATC